VFRPGHGAESLEALECGAQVNTRFGTTARLALLYAGLKRWRSLRLAGLALFAVSLGKIFVYDLPSLSSITRALSFLAVGAVLLLGGFFYQRLSSGDDVPTEPAGATP
jgi:uncharacterized membrane protein